MIKLITAPERREARVGDSLSSHYLFSFADYYDPDNVQFGSLRVFNDVVIGPGGSIPAHPQADMEVLTIVLDGEIVHLDNIGNEVTLAAGQVQRITAGTGITHSARNMTDKDAHVYQLWLLPNKRDLAPSYEQMDLGFLDKTGELFPLATGQKVLEDLVFLNSNSTVYYCNLGSGDEVDFRTFKIRKTLIYVTGGSLLIDNMEVNIHDQVRLEEQEVIRIHATSKASFILVDVPALEVNF
ncbi:pirin family protein [Pontibacter silvestris]|uniref:Pirin family protein n=1 Tax=Pontibacter silvestris TaxID=2305183 RepID=A0ABW4X072_9BACT|nr:pirin family protein [Pontibacter silvestris]MCC9135212.1 pirin family protein [Pontibacter silvestris]